MTTVLLDIRARDGTAITAEFGKDESQSIKGVVIISHGFGEHSGSYHELTRHLARAGYASVTFSQRGHGELQPIESRKKLQGIIPSYQCFLDDVGAVSAAVKQQVPGVPVALYGHSMWGNIVVNYLLRHNQSDYACAVLESPWLGLKKEVSPLVTGLAKIIGGFTPNIAIVNKLSPSDITGDPSKAEGFKNDPLYHNRISLRMFAGIKNGCAYAMANASKLTVPIFLAYAKQERIVSNRAIVQFLDSAGTDAAAKEYDSCHAIHNDVQRETFYKDLIGYLAGVMRCRSQE